MEEIKIETENTGEENILNNNNVFNLPNSSNNIITGGLDIDNTLSLNSTVESFDLINSSITMHD